MKDKNNPQIPHFGVKFSMLPIDGDFRILETDYDSYLIAYGFKKILMKTLQMGIILSRTKEMPPPLLLKCFAIYTERTGLKPDDFLIVHHD